MSSVCSRWTSTTAHHVSSPPLHLCQTGQGLAVSSVLPGPVKVIVISAILQILKYLPHGCHCAQLLHGSHPPHHNQFNLPELSSLLCFLLQTFRITIFFIICHSHLQIFSPKIFFFSSSVSGIEKYVSIFFCLFFSLE